MTERLKAWEELSVGGVVRPGESERQHTGGWRTGVRPQVELESCVNCLLCWVYCPDSAVKTLDGVFAGFDLDVCKGCEICATVCPTGAIAMVPDAD